MRARWADYVPSSLPEGAPERSPCDPIWFTALGLEPPRLLSKAEVVALTPGAAPEVLAGAALGMEICSEQSELFLQAARMDPRDPVLAGLLCSFLVLLETKWVPEGDLTAAEFRIQLVDRLLTRDQDNGHADLLRAYQYASAGFLAQARRCLVRASRCARLDFPERLLWRSVAAAAERAGWAPGKARELALGKGYGTTLLMRLKTRLLERPGLSPTVRQAFDSLGQRLERSPLIIDQMLGARFRGSRPARARPTGKLLEWLHTIDSRSVSDERWARYFEQLFTESEQAAIRALRRDLSY